MKKIHEFLKDKAEDFLDMVSLKLTTTKTRIYSLIYFRELDPTSLQPRRPYHATEPGPSTAKKKNLKMKIKKLNIWGQ